MSLRLAVVLLFCGLSLAGAARAAEFTQTIASVKKSVVGIGTYQQTRSPAALVEATGFAVGDGLHIITNAHAVNKLLNGPALEKFVVFAGQGEVLDIRQASVLGVDREHDLALLRIEGAPLPALQLGEAGAAAEGQELAFTGYPLGIFLGLYPVTHHAFLSAITPVVMPSLTSNKLSAAAIVQLQRDRFKVLQLDATAYPGNSGSPVYDPRTGVVAGVINMVFVKKLKESAISDPSGISYAIPVNHVRELLQRKGSAAK
jgi:S1-C subfamily serine protease